MSVFQYSQTHRHTPGISIYNNWEQNYQFKKMNEMSRKKLACILLILFWKWYNVYKSTRFSAWIPTNMYTHAHSQQMKLFLLFIRFDSIRFILVQYVSICEEAMNDCACVFISSWSMLSSSWSLCVRHVILTNEYRYVIVTTLRSYQNCHAIL